MNISMKNGHQEFGKRAWFLVSVKAWSLYLCICYEYFHEKWPTRILEESLTFGIGKSMIFVLCNMSTPRMFELWSTYYKANIYTEYLDIYLIFS